VSEHFQSDLEKIKERGIRNNLARRCAITLCWDHAGLSHDEIAALFRMASSNSVAQTIRRTKTHDVQTLKVLKHQISLSKRLTPLGLPPRWLETMKLDEWLTRLVAVPPGRNPLPNGIAIGMRIALFILVPLGIIAAIAILFPHRWAEATARPNRDSIVIWRDRKWFLGPTHSEKNYIYYFFYVTRLNS
jgi:hypothetical protein